MIRLVPNHATSIRRAPEVGFRFDGVDLRAPDGESLVTALMRAGLLHVRNAPVDGAARGAFCVMGLCQECVVRIDGQVVEACRVSVCDGLVVERV